MSRGRHHADGSPDGASSEPRWRARQHVGTHHRHRRRPMAALIAGYRNVSGVLRFARHGCRADDGAVDTGYGAGGYFVAPTTAGGGGAASLVVQPDGSAILSGTWSGTRPFGSTTTAASTPPAGTAIPTATSPTTTCCTPSRCNDGSAVGGQRSAAVTRRCGSASAGPFGASARTLDVDGDGRVGADHRPADPRPRAGRRHRQRRARRLSFNANATRTTWPAIRQYLVAQCGLCGEGVNAVSHATLPIRVACTLSALSALLFACPRQRRSRRPPARSMSFDGDGRVDRKVTLATSIRRRCCWLPTAGRIVVIGRCTDNSNQSIGCVTRFNEDGSPDSIGNRRRRHRPAVQPAAGSRARAPCSPDGKLSSSAPAYPSPAAPRPVMRGSLPMGNRHQLRRRHRRRRRPRRQPNNVNSSGVGVATQGDGKIVVGGQCGHDRVMVIAHGATEHRFSRHDLWQRRHGAICDGEAVNG